jgi:hypothetical protein
VKRRQGAGGREQGDKEQGAGGKGGEVKIMIASYFYSKFLTL